MNETKVLRAESIGGATGLQGVDRFLRIAEVSHRVGLGKSMIYDLIAQSRFPAPYKISPSASRWSEVEILAWIEKVKDGFEGKRRQLW